MQIINNIIPFAISIVTGILFLNVISIKDKGISASIKLFLGGGFGIGISAHITFLSYILLGQLNRNFVIIFNIILLLFLIILNIVVIKKQNESVNIGIKNLSKNTILPSLLFFILLIPIYYQASFYVHGGWDAWSAWNLKAKFLFLGGENWKNMFDPILWRSSPHYPLLLPMMITWGWSFVNEVNYYIPMLNSLLFTFLTAGLLFAGLKKAINTWIAIIPSIFILTLPFFQKIAFSQYCDLFLGYYLLATFVCLVAAKTDNSRIFGLLSGISMGFLSFTKSEGLLAALIILALSIPYILWKNKNNYNKTIIKYILLGAIISFIPTIIFKLFYAPVNLTFINGLFSSEHPITLLRFKKIMGFYFFELLSPIWNLIVFVKNQSTSLEYVILKWHGIWMISILGLILSWKKCFSSNIIVIGIFFMLYNLVIITYYLINTYFKIDWWMQVTLHRILFSILPTMLFWVFYSLWSSTKKGRDKI